MFAQITEFSFPGSQWEKRGKRATLLLGKLWVVLGDLWEMATQCWC